jgi:hypothetical protein
MRALRSAWLGERDVEGDLGVALDELGDRTAVLDGVCCLEKTVFVHALDLTADGQLDLDDGETAFHRAERHGGRGV